MKIQIRKVESLKLTMVKSDPSETGVQYENVFLTFDC